MVVNKAPHPASEDGKGIDFFTKRERNWESSRSRRVVARIVRFVPMNDDAVGVDGDDVAAAESAVDFPLRS